MSSREYGRGTYSVLRVGTDHILILADGQRPALNVTPVLEQLQWRIWPPHFALFFETVGDVGGTALTPFSIALLAPYPAELEMVTIIDADGPHDILFGLIDSTATALDAVVVEGKHYAVFRDLNDNANCLVAPVDAIVPATMYDATRDIQPLTYAEAVAWKAKNCSS